MARKYTKKSKKVWGFPESFLYVVNTDYSRDYHCYEDDSYCEDICRCSTLSDVCVEDVNLTNIANYIAKNVVLAPIDSNCNCCEEFFEYAIGRLLVIYKMYDCDNWYVEVGGGYYGEEIDDVTIENKDFINDVIVCSQLSGSDRIRFVLEKEYGFLLSKLEDVTFSVKNINTKNIVMANESYGEKVTPYSEDFDIMGVCQEINGKYRLIDGHHRYSYALKKELNKVKVLSF